MRRTSYEDPDCPVAQSLERVGERWTILILRDAYKGMTRFDQLEKSLKIAPNILTGRLASLVESGFLERKRYSERPPRDEYVLTERGRDFQEVVASLAAFGNRHFLTHDPSFVLFDTQTGKQADPMVIDAVSGQRVVNPRFQPRSTNQPVGSTDD
jgi:DNA-binding HxlR family transcriptional regulator